MLADPVRDHMGRYDCPYGCGWYREYTTLPHLLDKILDHPIYGRVRARKVIELDIEHHDCIKAIEARSRNNARERKQESLLVVRRQRVPDPQFLRGEKSDVGEAGDGMPAVQGDRRETA